MTRQHPGFLRLDHIWIVMAIALAAGISSLIPIGQVDFWWHLALGRDITQLGAIPRTSSHSWALPPETPFLYGSWLAEWLFYQLYRLGGLPLIVGTRNVLLAAMLALIGIEARRRSGSWRLAALAVGGLSLTILNNVGVRPQIFAWIPFALTMALLGAVRGGQLRPRWLLLLPLLMIFWVNVHGTFTLGLGLIGLTAIGESLKALLDPRLRDRARLMWYWGIGAVSGTTVLINPFAADIVTFVRNLVFHPAARQGGGEWQRTDLLAFPGLILPVLLIMIVIGWLRRRDRFDLTDALLLAGFTYFGVSAIRSLIWFALIAWPIAVGTLAVTRPRRPAARVGSPAINYAMIALLLALFVLAQPPVKPRLPLPETLAGLGATVPDGWLIESETPVAAVAWLRQQLDGDSRLFNDLTYGSYLIWAAPEIKVLADGRLELYPYDHWMEYQAILRNENALARLDRLGATHALLGRSRTPALIERLDAPTSGWTRVYTDDEAAIFARN
jgi:hypothetical protein